MINDISFITKKDLLNIMIKKVLLEKVNFTKNKNQSLFANQLIDKIRKNYNKNYEIIPSIIGYIFLLSFS